MMKINLDKVGAYTPMSVQHLQDEDISLAAKGLLSLMQTIPNRYERVDIASLYTYSSSTKNEVKDAFYELVDAEYIIEED